MSDTPEGKARRAVFLARSHADADAHVLTARLRLYYEVVEATSVASELPIALAVREAMREADVVLVLMPAPQDPARDNVVFEGGVAVGAGLPVVVAGWGGPPPGNFGGLPFVGGHDEASLRRALDKAPGYRRRRARGGAGGGVPATFEALRPDAAARLRQDLGTARGGAEMRDWAGRVFRSAGAEVVLAERPDDLSRADLSIWHDRLQAAFGLPLPVEILVKATNIRHVRDRLRRTMRLSGSKSLLAVVAGERPTNELWTDGTAKILAIDAYSLIDALSRSPLDVALVGLLDRAEPAQ